MNISATPTREKRTRQHGEKDGPRLKKQKKQVAATSSSAAGFIQICDVDPDGRFIQLKNMSDKVHVLLLLLEYIWYSTTLTYSTGIYMYM